MRWSSASESGPPETATTTGPGSRWSPARCAANRPGRSLTSAANPLHLVAEAGQFRHDPVAMITLDLDHAVLHGTAGRALFLEPAGELGELGGPHRHARDDGYA